MQVFFQILQSSKTNSLVQDARMPFVFLLTKENRCALFHDKSQKPLALPTVGAGNYGVDIGLTAVCDPLLCAI